MPKIFTHLIDAAQGKHPLGTARSGHWPTVRAAHLKLNPVCRLCGGADKLEVHHIKPFHIQPDLELNPSNLVTLCESGKGGINCHLACGHLGNFRSFNTSAVEDADAWHAKVAARPMGGA